MDNFNSLDTLPAMPVADVGGSVSEMPKVDSVWPVKKKNKWKPVLAVVLSLLIVGGGAFGTYYFTRNLNTAEVPNAPTSRPRADETDTEFLACKVAHLTMINKLKPGAYVSHDVVKNAAEAAGVSYLELNRVADVLTEADLVGVDTLFVGELNFSAFTEGGGPAWYRTITEPELNLINKRYHENNLNIVLAGDNAACDGNCGDEAAYTTKRIAKKLEPSINYVEGYFRIPETAGISGVAGGSRFFDGLNFTGVGLDTPGLVNLTQAAVQCLYWGYIRPDWESVKDQPPYNFYNFEPHRQTCMLSYSPRSGTKGAFLLDANAGMPARDGLAKGKLVKSKPASVCAPCTDTTWTPDPALTCVGTKVTQTSNCGKTREVDGTKTDGACLVCTNTTWTPAVSTKCINVDFIQTSNCNATRSAEGTKTGTIECGDSPELTLEKKAYEDESNNASGDYHLTTEIDTVSKNQVFVYAFVVENLGTAPAAGITVTDILKGDNQEQLTYVDGDSRCRYTSSTRTVVCSGMNLAVDATDTYKIRVKVSDGAVNGEVIKNLATLKYTDMPTDGGLEASLELNISTVVGCNNVCTGDSECVSGLSCDPTTDKCRKAACADSSNCNCAVVTAAPTARATRAPTVYVARVQPTVLPETGILDFPGVAAFGGGLLLAIVGILLAL